MPKTIKGESIPIKEIETVIIIALLMSNIALGIDSLIPALPSIGETFLASTPTQLGWIITSIFIGLGIGEIIFGPLSDSIGRKKSILIGAFIFITGLIISLKSESLNIMLLGRVIQGIGVSSFRTVSISIITDSFKGTKMNKVMSSVMSVFLLIPMIAPVIGQLLNNTFNWKAIILFQIFFFLTTILWFYTRQRETLVTSNKIPLSRKNFKKNFNEFTKSKPTILYTLILGLIEGVFILYLSSYSDIFKIHYGLQNNFLFVFFILSITLIISTLSNRLLLNKYTPTIIIRRSLQALLVVSSMYFVLFILYNSISLSVYVVLTVLQFLSIGLIFGNATSLAMNRITHIAGIGSSIHNFLVMILGTLISVLYSFMSNSPNTNLFLGFLISSALSMITLIIYNLKNEKDID